MVGLVEDLRSSHGPWPLFVPEVARWSHPGPDLGDLTGPPLLEWEGVVVMVIHSLPRKALLLIWEKEGMVVAIGLLPLLGREGMVAMVVHSFLLRNDPPLLGKERHDRGHRSRSGGHGHTHLSS